MAYSESYEYTTTVYSNNCISVRKVDIITKDGVEVGRGRSETVIQPGDDVSDQPAIVKAIAGVVHTADVVAAFKQPQAGTADS